MMVRLYLAKYCFYKDSILYLEADRILAARDKKPLLSYGRREPFLRE